MKKMFLMAAFCCTAALQAQDYYVVTGDNVNVRSQPVTGKVVGKVSSVNSFTGWDAGNGWVNFRIPSVSGAISDKFVRKVALRDFSRSMLGEYMGKAPLPVSYSMGTLSEREGYVVLQVTDYTEPDGESGLRGHMSHVYAGIPNKDGISFTHYLYPYSEDKPLVQQMADAGPLEQPYEFVVTEEGELRAYDRVLELQKSAGSQGAKMTERDIYMLKGNVKQARLIRVYPENMMKSLQEEENGNHPLCNFCNIMRFSPDGKITYYEGQKSTVGKLEQVDSFTYTYDGKKVAVNGKRYGQPFQATYIREDGEFGIRYEGNFRAGEFSAGLIDCQYAVNMDGVPFHVVYGSTTPPFVAYGNGESYEATFRYGENSTLPESMDFSLDYGGDSWNYDGCEIRAVKTDEHGNWTESMVYVDGQPIFKEIQTIVYY